MVRLVMCFFAIQVEKKSLCRITNLNAVIRTLKRVFTVMVKRNVIEMSRGNVYFASWAGTVRTVGCPRSCSKPTGQSDVFNAFRPKSPNENRWWVQHPNQSSWSARCCPNDVSQSTITKFNNCDQHYQEDFISSHSFHLIRRYVNLPKANSSNVKA